MNDNPDFKTETTAAVHQLKKAPDWKIETGIVTDSFVRIAVHHRQITLKIDFVNDIEFHRGAFRKFDIFHKVDHWKNILSNKLCALSRMDPKDIVDILFIAANFKFDWKDVFQDAREKDLWVEPLSVCRLFDEFPFALLDQIKWSQKVDTEYLKNSLKILINDIVYGQKNSLIS